MAAGNHEFEKRTKTKGKKQRKNQREIDIFSSFPRERPSNWRDVNINFMNTKLFTKIRIQAREKEQTVCQT